MSLANGVRFIDGVEMSSGNMGSGPSTPMPIGDQDK